MADHSALRTLDKLLFDIPLAPVQGRRFQPTGFPDLGPATFETEEGTCLLVESAQSMANRLEATCWDEAANELAADLRGLSYVRVHDKDGRFLTSSVLEAHRINSVYIEKADGGSFHKMLAQEIGIAKDRPFERAGLARALLRYDAGSLIHGAFLESIDGRLRVARALTAFIEAEGVTTVASGGVKNDHVKPATTKDDEDKEKRKTAAEGYGNVPFHRDEFAAKAITLFVNVDLAQIRGYGLGEDATKMLTWLCLFKVRALLDGRLRLRTACDFKVIADGPKAANADFVLPPRSAILAELAPALAACGPLFAKNGVTTVTYAG